MEYIDGKIEFIRIAKKLGNSSGVLLPKSLLGAEVKVQVIRKLQKPLNIKAETLKLLNLYLKDILGIYITSKNPIEILAISGKIKRIIKSEKIKISIVPLTLINQDIKKSKPLKEKIQNSETIMNLSLLRELRKL